MIRSSRTATPILQRAASNPGFLNRRGFLAGAISATASWAPQLTAQCAGESTVSNLAQMVDTRLMQDVAAYRIPSVSYAVLGCQGIRVARALGVLRAGQNVAATRNTLFQAASISKTVAAVTALRLVQDGKLALDEPVDSMLKSWKLPPGRQSPAWPVTLRRLLGMTAGVNIHGFGGYQEGELQPNPVQILEGKRPANSPPVRVMNRPGSQQLYSGGGYQIAEMLMHDATGQRYADLAASLVFAPLKMTNSHFDHPLPARLAASAAEGHNNMGVPLPGRWHNYPELAAAGLWTTPTDLGLLCSGLSRSWLTNRGFLRQDLVKEMMTRVDRFSYGLGGAVSPPGMEVVFSKSGDNAGYKCTMVFFPQTGEGMAIMTNGDQGERIFARAVQIVATGLHWPRYGLGG
jgi:CubicO group peptidase (beta-lactamase class C family)